MSIAEIENRRSIRKYRPDPVPSDLLEQILSAGRAAPSGKNKQPWKFIVFGGLPKKELLMQMEAGLERELSGRTCLPASGYGLPDAVNTLKIMKQAPVVILIMIPGGKSPFEPLPAPDERFTEIVDSLSAGAAIENMLLQAEHLGLGTLWIANTCFAYPELTGWLKMPGQLLGAVALGYAAEKPAARPRKPLEQIVEYRL